LQSIGLYVISIKILDNKNIKIMRLTLDKLERAVQIIKQIKRLEKELDKIFTGVAPTKEIPKAKRAKRKISAEARARIAAAQKERWARVHAKQSAQGGK